MTKILLEKATLEDLKEIADLEKIAGSKTYSPIIGDSELETYINNESVFLIKRQNVVIGSVAYKIVKRNIAHLDGLIISPKFRRKGFARQTMTIILKKVSQYHRIELSVHPHNNPAIRLYLSLGFVIESWEDNYFGDGEPRLILVKR